MVYPELGGRKVSLYHMKYATNLINIHKTSLESIM